jgi:hypothetical protein
VGLRGATRCHSGEQPTSLGRHCGYGPVNYEFRGGAMAKKSKKDKKGKKGKKK